MKKSILTAIILAGGISSAFSQTLFVPGGFSTTGVGTSNISGKVGVGTSSPAEKLHVIGNVRFNLSQGNLKFTDSPLAGPGGMAISANDNMLSLPQPLALVASKFYFTGGNVGIGTNNPSYSLSINKNGHTYSVNPHSNGIDLHSTGNYSPHYQTSFNIYKGNIGSGQLKFTVDQNGNTGIGTSTPTEKLEVNGNLVVGSSTATWGNGDGGKITFRRTYDGQAMATITLKSTGIDQADQFAFYSPGGGSIYTFSNAYNNGNGGELMRIDYYGGVGIGTTNTAGYKLSVAGNMRAEAIEVSLMSSWSDFVFADDYQLNSLDDVEKFIEKNKHLPDVPSEKEVLANGFDLAKMDAILLQKIEELTLYMIALKKENEELRTLISK